MKSEMSTSRCSKVALLQNKLITDVKQEGGVKATGTGKLRMGNCSMKGNHIPDMTKSHTEERS